jgi:aspartate aminotransferase-like enzyme
MKKNYLLSPGPTPLPPEVCEAQSRPIIHHRTPQYLAILKEVLENLKYVFQTKNDVLIFTSSGTGAMEASVVNLLSGGDKAICVQAGKFGERWAEICKAYKIEPVVIDVPWGKSVDPKLIQEKLNTIKPAPKVVFTTLCETSTGVTTDIEQIAKVVKNTEAVLVTDAISALGVLPCFTDDWGVDVVISGSQKGLMIPPGLAFCSVSEKAWKLAATSTCPKFYYDYKKYKKALEQSDTPFTSAISLIIALNESLRLIRKDGLEKVFKNYHALANAVRSAALGMGLELFADKTCASDAVTAIKVPVGIDGESLVKIMRDEYGVTVAGGQDAIKGKVIRIAHMGYINEFDIMLCLSCLEKVLIRLGYKFNVGSGLKAAQEVLIKEIA